MVRGGWIDSVTPVSPPTAANPGLRALTYTALVTGIWAGIVCLVVYGLARLFGVPMEAQTPAGIQTVPWFAVLLLPLLAAEIGAMAALATRGWKGAQRIVFGAGTFLAVASLIPLAFQPEQVLLSTRIWLGAMHGITWVLVVPQLARTIGDSEPGMHEEREVMFG